jgi:hypothetical protein
MWSVVGWVRLVALVVAIIVRAIRGVSDEAADRASWRMVGFTSHLTLSSALSWPRSTSERLGRCPCAGVR